MSIPVAIFLKKLERGYALGVRDLRDATDHQVTNRPIERITKAYTMLDELADRLETNPKYEIVYKMPDVM
jgi:hypothetical protein